MRAIAVGILDGDLLLTSLSLCYALETSYLSVTGACN